MEQINNGVNEKNFICVEYSPALKAQFEEIFNDEFMKKHTNFKSFESFRYSSAVIVNWNAEDLILAYDENEDGAVMSAEGDAA